jgi:hypothetical protein
VIPESWRGYHAKALLDHGRTVGKEGQCCIIFKMNQKKLENIYKLKNKDVD